MFTPESSVRQFFQLPAATSSSIAEFLPLHEIASAIASARGSPVAISFVVNPISPIFKMPALPPQQHGAVGPSNFDKCMG